jgi:AraC-like DNA-binding protein
MCSKESQTLQETKQHGSVWFPFDLYPCTIPLDFPAVPLHWHRDMELTFIKKGSCEIQIGIESFQGKAGDIFTFAPRALHAIRGTPGESVEYETIMFDPVLLGSGAADITAQRYIIPLTAGQLALPLKVSPDMPEYGRIAECLEEIENLSGERPTGYELGIRGELLRFIYLLLQMEAPIAPKETPQTDRLRDVLHMVETDYSQNLTVERAAENCGLSASHFMRWFRQMTGSSFITYLNERRLSVAAQMLLESDDNILNIAQSVGFESLSNFNRQFKKRYGATPSEYRNDERYHRPHSGHHG